MDRSAHRMHPSFMHILLGIPSPYSTIMADMMGKAERDAY
jgi:hypothetical protein